MIKQIYKNNSMSTLKLQSLFKVLSVQYLFTASNASHRAIVISNRSGNYQLHAVDFESGFHRQVTNKKGGALFGSISPDGQYIYWLKDEAGGEYGNFVKVPFAGGKPINITPKLKPYFSYSIASDDKGELLCFTATAGNNNKVFAVQVENNVYKTNEIYSSDSYLSEAICSSNGKYVCVAETNNQTGKNSLVLLSLKNKSSLIYSKLFDGGIPLSFLKKSEEPIILALTKTNNWLRPVLYNFTKDRVSKIDYQDFCGDVWVLGWNKEQEEIILCDIYKAQQKLYKYNIKTKEIKRIGPLTGSFNFHFNSVAYLKNKSLIVRWSDFNTSPRLIQITSPTHKKWKEVNEWSGDIKSQYKIKNVSIRSSDGEDVQMWVVFPKNKNRKLSFVIDIHGGPHGVNNDEFSPEAQAWLANGFGYCAVNYRGSISFGKKFEKKIYGDPGYWEVEDVVAARNWLVDNNYASSKNIVLYGWSWGGYITLLALGKYPDLWNCGIAGSAIADCLMQYEDEPAYFKAQDIERFNGTPNTTRAQYMRSSPITYINNIQAPIFLLHGENDVRCPPRQIRHFIDKLKKMNKTVSIKWFSSGHTGEFTNTSLRLKLIDKILHFAKKNRKEGPLRN
ncbi:MAG TPA: S9 family peptidase [Candidatus Vogelbacteria bacterium]|nr:S9 family peptidase [Candidatus Vogelbacteria bacterium]